ncbi:AfsR/SARP family transcriptional regulator [Nocardia terpenica]|uniref:Transcriptional regulator n=1 Tax=Nocardia terpenica TaxID=455432 RepID=A0A291RE74_9NOCA|nr:AfsR/SARP family transcriptional regulator [Nocardia terpenica]ATL65635.1 transcriptional regulator [Nocardia terpenica]
MEENTEMLGGSGLRFTVLGPLRVAAADRAYAVQGVKVKTILATLIARANRTVGVEALGNELWGAQRPRHPETTVRMHIYHLRQALTQHLGVPGDSIVRTQSPGYRLAVDADRIDAGRFEACGERGVDLLRRGLPAEAAAISHAALRLWQGPSALTDVAPGPILGSYVTHLEEMRLRVLGCYTDALMALNRHEDAIPPLRELVADHPLNESFHARLIAALHHTGRRADALHAFHNLRAVLSAELGLEPSAELLALQREILHTSRVMLR